MKRHTFKLNACCALLLAVCALQAAAVPLPGSGPFFAKHAEGYWWYAKEPDPKKPEVPKKTEPVPVIVAEQEQKLDKAEPEKAAPVVAAATPPTIGSTEWIRKNLLVYRELAWQDPTPINLAAYLYLQRYAIDRSEAFAYAGRMAVQGDPLLDEAARSPLGGAMNVSRRVYLDEEQKHVVRKLFKKVGIFFVFKNNEASCIDVGNRHYCPSLTPSPQEQDLHSV